MLLMLTDDFTFYMNGEIRAYVDKDGILKIDSRFVYWNQTMYALAYHVKDKRCCPYCGNNIKKQQLTVDHMFPRDYGGVSISNNLLPCCRRCNSLKGNLSEEEFMEYKERETKEEMNDFRNKIIREKEKFRYVKGFILPDEWIIYRYIEDLKVRDYYKKHYQESKKLTENLRYIEKYNHLKRPIIVDKNMWILDGYTCYLAAKRSGRFRKIPIIQLDNVELTII